MKQRVCKGLLVACVCLGLLGCGYTEIAETDAVYPEYDSISSYTEGYAYFCVDGKYGYVDESGAMVIEPVYQDAGYVKDGRAVVSIGSRYGVIDTDGNEIIPIVYDYVEYDDSCFVILQDEEIIYYNRDGEQIQELTDRTDDSEESGADVLRNEITKRQKDFWQVVKEAQPEYEELDKQCFRYYEINDIVMLYYYAEPTDWMGMPFSESALYVDNGTEVAKILSASECGGSSGGNYIGFYTDTETDEVMIGTYGHAGGFGGRAIDGMVYRYRDGNVEEIFSYMCIEQIPYNYEEEELMQNAHLFYGEDGEPCTAETIWDEAYITEYIINDKRVTREEYETARTRYKTCYRTLE
ncbi:MAG: WG repeat-containing protein [Lachnospiraceae bacterium]|nr:WG repeat-containing protein [Lachnospiraceae bacterium]